MDEDCVEMTTSGTWHDRSCSDSDSYRTIICEMSGAVFFSYKYKGYLFLTLIQLFGTLMDS